MSGDVLNQGLPTNRLVSLEMRVRVMRSFESALETAVQAVALLAAALPGDYSSAEKKAIVIAKVMDRLSSHNSREHMSEQIRFMAKFHDTSTRWVLGCPSMKFSRAVIRYDSNTGEPRMVNPNPYDVQDQAVNIGQKGNKLEPTGSTQQVRDSKARGAAHEADAQPPASF